MRQIRKLLESDGEIVEAVELLEQINSTESVKQVLDFIVKFKHITPDILRTFTSVISTRLTSGGIYYSFTYFFLTFHRSISCLIWFKYPANKICILYISSWINEWWSDHLWNYELGTFVNQSCKVKLKIYCKFPICLHFLV